MHRPLPPLQILEECAEWIVVDKPAFLQVHPSKPGEERTLWHQLRELLAFELACGGQISFVNRLDRETSGVTLVAKTRAAAREFGMQMMRQVWRKEYLAVVWGWPAEETWEVEAPLLRQGERQPSRIYLKRVAHPEGAPASTRFAVVRRFRAATSAGEEFAIVRAWPRTGRTHQIRVHLALSGHPVVGDKIYGPDEGCYLEFIETGWTESLAARLLLPRHALHAASLGSEDGEHCWRAPWPADLAAFAGAV